METHDGALKSTVGETRDVFLSHVSDDKESVVRPFARALEVEGIGYWLDEAELGWGDSLTRGINRGLAISDYVMPFLTQELLERGWPQAELAAAYTAQMEDGQKRLLPVLVAKPNEVFRAYPLLRDLKCEHWADGIPALIKKLKGRLRQRQA